MLVKFTDATKPDQRENPNPEAYLEAGGEILRIFPEHTYEEGLGINSQWDAFTTSLHRSYCGRTGKRVRILEIVYEVV